MVTFSHMVGTYSSGVAKLSRLPKSSAMLLMIWYGRVGFRALEKFGNDLADRAADVGRRSLPPQVIDPRGLYLAAIWEWSPIVYDFQRYFIALSRNVFIDDGTQWVGPSPDCLGQ